MKRLTFKEPCGKWGVAGMDKPVYEFEEKIYRCFDKLKDYEELGLNPDDMEQKLMELRHYRETGLNPDDIRRLKSRLEDMEENLQIIEKELNQLKAVKGV